MAWGIDRHGLEAGRDEMRARVAERASYRALKQLARATAGLGEDEEALTPLREAAADLEQRIEARGRGDSLSRGLDRRAAAAGREARRGARVVRARARVPSTPRRRATPTASPPCATCSATPEGALVAAALAEEPDPILEPTWALAQARRGPRSRRGGLAPATGSRG